MIPAWCRPARFQRASRRKEVGAIEGYDGTTVLRRVRELLFISDPTARPTGFLAALDIVTAASKRRGQV
jgi:hypothetical protein